MIDSSAKSSFRELDDVFLQTQTRIWLGEVLNTRFDQDLHLSLLLQDGEILFEVSKAVWNKLITKCMELRHLKNKYSQFGSKRSSGRYRPYSNVDSFLKICKILGLSGIDLFSPSDVVEKRDIRKVCICIRALSKKSRSKQLSVPDFDLVIYSVTMPTVMVGGIRRSLESSQWTLSSSSSYSSQKGPQTKLKKKNLSTPSSRDDDSSSDESNEAESRYMSENSFPSACKLDYTDEENSPEVHSTCDVKEDRYNCKYGSVDVSNTEFALDNDGSVVGDSSCINSGESNYISDYLAFSDLMVHKTEGTDPVILDGEKNMFDFFLNVDSQKLGSDEKGSRRTFCDDEDMEVSSTTSMSSVLGRLLNLEFDDQFDAQDSSSANVYSSVSMEREVESHYNNTEIIEGELCDTQSSNLENAFNLDNETRISEDNGNETFSTSNSDLSLHLDDPISANGKVISEDKKEHVNGKHGKKPLLKTVVKGTAIAGVLFLLMHIRKNRGNNAQGRRQNGSVSNYSGSKFSSTKQQTGNRGKGIYPAEKIKLGN